jgi:hypothetical protein
MCRIREGTERGLLTPFSMLFAAGLICGHEGYAITISSTCSPALPCSLIFSPSLSITGAAALCQEYGVPCVPQSSFQNALSDRTRKWAFFRVEKESRSTLFSKVLKIDHPACLVYLVTVQMGQDLKYQTHTSVSR